MIANSPRTINWNFTDLCNFNCLHCYTRGRPKKQELSKKEMLNIASDIVKSRVFSVNFGGGEPVLLIENLLEVIKLLSSANIQCTLSSNGYLLNSELLRSLKKAGLDSLYISVDSTSPEIHDHIRNKCGSFHKAMESITQAQEEGVKVGFSTVVSKFNMNDIENIIQLAITKKCKFISLKRFRPVGNGERNQSDFKLPKTDEEKLLILMSKMRNEYSKIIVMHFVYTDFPVKGISEGCPCGRESLAIMPNGDLKMCVYGYTVIGNLCKGDSLIEIWNHHPYLVRNRIQHVCEALNDGE